MTFANLMLRKSDAMDLKSSVVMFQLQRVRPDLSYQLREKSSDEMDSFIVVNSLCKVLRDTDVILASLLDWQLHATSLGVVSDTKSSKTYPNALFLKLVWNIFTHENLNSSSSVRPKRCVL